MRLGQLPLRLRLVSGFAAAMLVVLSGAGGFVYWRVRIALDLRLNEDLRQQLVDLQRSVAAHPGDPRGALTSVPAEGRFDQLLRGDGRVIAAGQDVAATRLVPPSTLRPGAQPARRYDLGHLLLARGRRLRVEAAPVPGPGQVRIAVAAVRLDQRDEALRELLAQLAIANLLALAVASVVGYRLARAALAPVERYRSQAEQITAGVAGVRLEVPAGRDDEVTRLGRTLNTMLAVQEEAADHERRFIADASHELRTPLTLLTSEVELALRRRRSHGELEATLRAIADDTARLVTLADNLLALEAAYQDAPRQADVDVAPALAAAAARARAVLPEGSPRRVIVRAPASLTAYADDVTLRRMLDNAAENAARHGRGDITLWAERGTSAVTVAVHDEGGIPLEFLPHAAERFRRADGPRTTPGSGLGLALVDALARSQHGQLRLCSNGAHHAMATPGAQLSLCPCVHPELGTTTSVLLPVAPSG